MKKKLVGIFICMLLIASAVPALGNILNDNKTFKKTPDNCNNLIKEGTNGCFNPADWLEQDKLIASDGDLNDWFGKSVSIDGDYAIVGAYWDDDNGIDSGSAYIFKRSGTTWSQEAKLLPSDGDIGEQFGFSVSIDGDYAIIGARYDDENGHNSGSAYIFKRSGTTWSQQAKLLPNEGDPEEEFGFSVSIDGEYAIIGEPYWYVLKGSAFIFKRSGSTWSQQTKLTNPNPDEWGGFGSSVSIDGDSVLIGAPFDDGINGSAFVYKRSGTTWSYQATLSASDPVKGKEFGNSVSIDGDYAVIGAWGDNYLGIWTGSAYIFKRSGTTWSQQTKLTASDEESGKYFGISVSISGDYAIVGADGDNDNGYNSGSAYIFKRSGTTWSQQKKLIPLNIEAGDLFGCSVSIDGDYAICGALGDDDNDLESGAAYVFNRYEEIPSIPILELVNIKGGVLGFSVGLKNFGDRTAYDITWELNVKGGLLYPPNSDSGEIDQLEPGEEQKINLNKLMFGLGRSIIEYHCKYKMFLNTSKSELDVETKQEWRDLGLLFGHVFPDLIQPKKDWMEVEVFDYREEGIDKFVELKYQGINNMHNVRALDSDTSEVLYLGACCFENGAGILEEGWITKGDIENNLAFWEVELVDGK
jgi:hypothetical protein